MAKPTPTQSATVSTDDQNTETVIRKPERFNTKGKQCYKKCK